MAAPCGPRSGRGLKSATRRPVRAYAPVAGSPTWPTAHACRASSRSKSLPTSASSAVRGGAGGATAHPRPRKCRRPRRRACSRAHPSGPACGRACYSSATPASVRCAGSPRGSPTRDLPSPAGTLGDGTHRFTPLFEPPAGAILARQNEAAVRHGDETTWARSVAPRARTLEPRLAVDLGQHGLRLLPRRPLARRGGREDTVRRGRPPYGRRLRPLRRLQEDGAHSRGPW